MSWPEVVAITETWCTEEELKLMNIEGYQLATSYSRNGQRGGGTAIFIHSGINYKVKNVTKMSIDSIFEVTAVDIENNSNFLTLSCLYRAPSSDFNTFSERLECYLNKFVKYNQAHIFCGDFNINFICDSVRAREITSIMNGYGLFSCINEVSRSQGNSETLIDNIFLNIDLPNIRTSNILTGFSDHHMQVVTIPWVDSVQNGGGIEFEYTRNFKKDSNIITFKKLISNQNWNLVLQGKNASEAFDLFSQKFVDIMEQAFPLELHKYKRNLGGNKYKKKKGWLTNDIIQEGRMLHDLYQQLELTNNNTLKDKYKQLLGKHRISIRNAKRTYNDTTYNNANSKSKCAWSIINNEINLKPFKQYPQMFVDKQGITITDFNLAASKFNDFFIDSVKRDTDRLSSGLLSLNNGSVMSDKASTYGTKSMFLRETSSEEIIQIIQNVTKTNAAGTDKVPCSLLSVVSVIIAPILSFLVNMSFSEGIFPTNLKKSVVKPIHKKNETNKIENYRAISILPAFSKVYERAFYNRLLNFLNRNDILSSAQFGFRSRLSTQDAVVSTVNNVIKNLDRNNKVAGLFFDYSRAFDMVNHDILKLKLYKCGVRGVPLLWISSYLNGRLQKVLLTEGVHQYYSQYRPVNIGVPQGSILGPLLFITFINDIVNSLKDTSLTLYADDITAIATAGSVEALSRCSQEYVETIQKYSKDNALLLNTSKTELVFFSSRSLDHSLYVQCNNRSLVQTDSTKFLGIYIDSQLTWKNHFDSILKKLATSQYVIWQLRQKVNRSILISYYHAHVGSVLSYGVVCWGNAKGVNEILLSQKRIIRTMLFKNSRTSCRELFKQLQILTVISIFILRCAIYVQKNIHTFLTSGDAVTGYTLRKGDTLRLPSHKLALTARSSLVMPVKIYNHLPNSLKEIRNIAKFKIKLKRMLLRQTFYSIQEFFGAELSCE